MIKYNYLEKNLHSLLLGNKFLKKSIFEIEKIFLAKNNIDDNKHVFITGLPRSGTTALLNYLHLTNNFSSLKYSDMPFVMAPNFYSKFKSKKKNVAIDRYHKDNLKIDIESPESFDEIFFSTFNEEQIINELSYFVSNVISKYKNQRYLSKNNNNFKRIFLIKKVFNNSVFLIPFRNPLEHSSSLLNQHLNFLSLQKKDKFILKYMNYLGHNEFGLNQMHWFQPNKHSNKLEINYWLEQWCFFYKFILNNYKNEENIYLIDYTRICSDDKYLDKINKICNVNSIEKNFFKKSERKFDIKKLDANIILNSEKIFQELITL